MQFKRTNFSTPWTFTIILSLLYASSMLDRYILSLLAQPIIAEFHITDEQMGLLLGAGFAILYSIAGLPAAHFIDRSRRIPIIVAGVMIWSLSTMASAFAWGFWTLGAARAGVAIGEAVLTPAAVSIIADLFPKDKRGPPVAVYSMTAAIMGTGAVALGGLVYHLAQNLASDLGMSAWRITLLLVGAPGPVIALVLAIAMREPERAPVPNVGSQDDSTSIKAFCTELVTHRSLFLPFYMGVTATALYIFGLSTWAPTILIRSYGMEASSAGYLLGVMGVPGAILAAVLWPSLSAFLSRAGWHGHLLATQLISAMVLAPVIIIAIFTASPWAFVIGVGVVKLANSTSTVAPLTIQYYGPSRMRGRLTALYVLTSSVIGLSGGALLVPLLANFWPENPNSLAYGLSTLGVGAVSISIPSFWFAHRAAAKMTSHEQV
ncbi:Predicted arabinose efflux permease, MFS family [Sphingobium sp. AP50]|uniref:MFS transporter n=1 Tax=Sphingobium sp. AP50 TaxID=1884369 RepID=UPI0008C1773D|nr:MFS transporter [Sphingobium sp. AP50]SEJ66174.1 Predicted arabinose efflux permease, MFS family [Sphingobium sp. AP50]